MTPILIISDSTDDRTAGVAKALSELRLDAKIVSSGRSLRQVLPDGQGAVIAIFEAGCRESLSSLSRRILGTDSALFASALLLDASKIAASALGMNTEKIDLPDIEGLVRISEANILEIERPTWKPVPKIENRASWRNRPHSSHPARSRDKARMR